MVLTLVIPVRAAYRLQNVITIRHLDLAARVMLANGWIVALGYASEHWASWLSDEPYDQYMTWNRITGPYAIVWWVVMLCNVLAAQALWWRCVRTHPPRLFAVALIIQVGMWAERYLIVITSLHRDFLPSAWGMFHGTFWDWATFAGSLGLFFTLLLLFIRLLPMVAIAETRQQSTGEGT
jgi:molybdopterin-containing oxidoreductase family membrane subunit